MLEGPRLEILNGYTEMGQGVFTTVRQAVCEETGLSPEIMNVRWDKELGAKCGETWASRATTLSCAAAQRAAQKLAADLKELPLEKLVGREYRGDYVCDFTTRPGTPEALKNPTTHMTFSYATQVVILDDDGRIERVIAAHDVGHAINPKACAGQIEGGVHMGLGYALSENFTSTNGVPDSLLLRDCGILRRQGHAADRRDPDRSARRSRRLRSERRRRNWPGAHGRRRGGCAALLRRYPPLQSADAGFPGS